jgi:hypothetical protein
MSNVSLSVYIYFQPNKILQTFFDLQKFDLGFKSKNDGRSSKFFLISKNSIWVSNQKMVDDPPDYFLDFKNLI